MKLMLRPEWRPRPLSAFIGCLDLKTGVILAVFFALLNKVAGVYGLIAALTGAGGSFAQISLYVYSALALIALLWGLKAVTEEDPKRMLYFAHLFFADHVLSTAWTAFFAVVWWVYTPHDGRRTANSPAQEDMVRAGHAAGHGHNMTETERAESALAIWNREKGFAAAVICAGWITKFYFAALLYSYAVHLRRGSYRTLPHTRPTPVTAAAYSALHPDSVLGEAEDDEDDAAAAVEDFYRLPLRTPGGSLGSVAEFASAGVQPAPPRRAPGWGLGKAGSPITARTAGAQPMQEDGDDEVLFDDGEGSLGGRQSKLASAEESSTSSAEDGRRSHSQGARR